MANEDLKPLILALVDVTDSLVKHTADLLEDYTGKVQHSHVASLRKEIEQLRQEFASLRAIADKALDNRDQ